jgi:hypothetical protein
MITTFAPTSLPSQLSLQCALELSVLVCRQSE